MSQLAIQQSRATIVMIARERHALTDATLEGLIANTPRPYRLIYTDGRTPEWLWQRLEQRSSEWGLELVRYDEPLWPQELRNRVLESITTEYVVYIDNDVLVSPNWLEKLVACADETHAGIVGPLYLWGDGKNRPKIHAYTGSCTHIDTPQGTVMTESHALVNADPDTVTDQLVRKPCDFVEFHCMLLRTAALKKMGGFDASILNVHEHIDTSLTMKQLGYTVYTEPAAQITYLAYAPNVLDDLPMHRWRWAQAPTEASIRAFCAKWQVLDHPLAFDGIRNYAHRLSITVNPIRPVDMDWPDLNTPMQRHELSQTRSDLLDQATKRSYAAQEIDQLAKTYHLAQSLTDGGYRPCGRPFINHLVGTASVLVRYGFKIEIVLAGLLHTLYSHTTKQEKSMQTILAMLAALPGGIVSTVESRVRAYTRLDKKCDALLAIPASRLTVLDAEVIIMSVANEIDMILSGEIRYSGRSGVLPDSSGDLVTHVCRVLGVGGLAQTFAACTNLPAVAPELLTKTPASYYMRDDKEYTVPMTNKERNESVNTTPIIDANILEKWSRCVIILRKPLVILSTAQGEHERGMLGCAGMLPHLFVGRRSLHLISFNQFAVPRVARILEELRWAAVNLPLARFCYLASDEEELFALSVVGIDAFMGNLNIFINERVFRPLSGGHVPARYDAVYDASFTPVKNHHLCSEIEKLALIYYSYPGMPDNEAEVRQLLPHAHYMNHERGQGHYRKLSPAEVNVILNQSSVGLCLSYVEGAMRASMQYLLAGTPVVTVPSKGGRERYFLPPYIQIVGADTRSIARAIERSKVLQLPRSAVREYAATLVSFERRNFLQALNLRIQKMFGSETKVTDFSVFFDAAIGRPLKERLKALL